MKWCQSCKVSRRGTSPARASLNSVSSSLTPGYACLSSCQPINKKTSLRRVFSMATGFLFLIMCRLLHWNSETTHELNKTTPILSAAVLWNLQVTPDDDRLNVLDWQTRFQPTFSSFLISHHNLGQAVWSPEVILFSLKGHCPNNEPREPSLSCRVRDWSSIHKPPTCTRPAGLFWISSTGCDTATDTTRLKSVMIQSLTLWLSVIYINLFC